MKTVARTFLVVLGLAVSFAPAARAEEASAGSKPPLGKASPDKPAADGYSNVPDLVAAVLPGYVNIYDRKRLETPAPEKEGVTVAAAIEDEVGSGMIISADGLILTNRHVIEQAYAISVTLWDGRRLPAKLIGKALNYDVAILKIDAGGPLTPATLGDSDALRLGQKVVAIGNPLGFASSVTTGVVSQLDRSVGLSAYDHVIQTDAPINRGNSGGPLFDMSGRVIGVNQAIYTQNKGGSIGIGFAIPINSVKFLLENIKQNGELKIGFLGIAGQSLTLAMADALGLNEAKGAIVADVGKDTPAEKAGLQTGDVILTIGGWQATNMDVVNRVVAISLDRSLQIGILRNGERTEVSAHIVRTPNAVWSTTLAPTPKIESFADVGLTFESEAPDARPVVKAVASKSIADTAGLRVGDEILRVGAQKIETLGQFIKIVHERRISGTDNGLMLVRNAGSQRWVGLSIRE